MAWVTLDDNFPNHPKAVAAGPVAAYLFVCGLCYCRKFHTDGFIPAKAVKTLGVSTNPAKLIASLLMAKLWEPATDGYRVHDYQAMYPDDLGDKAVIEERRQQKRDAGRKGGLKTWVDRRSALAGALAESEQPAEATAKAHRSGEGSDLALVLSKEEKTPHMDRWLLQLQALYPSNRVTRGFMTSALFFEQLAAGPESPSERFALMLAHLENQKAGHEWKVKGMIPRLEKWLREGLWLNEHPADAPVAEQLSTRTLRTVSAAAAIMREPD